MNRPLSAARTLLGQLVTRCNVLKSFRLSLQLLTGSVDTDLTVSSDGSLHAAAPSFLQKPLKHQYLCAFSPGPGVHLGGMPRLRRGGASCCQDRGAPQQAHTHPLAFTGGDRPLSAGHLARALGSVSLGRPLREPLGCYWVKKGRCPGYQRDEPLVV